MPFVFGILGILFIVSGVRGTVTGSNPNLVGLVKSDLTGQPNYTEWMAAILVLGALGYINQLRSLSRAFMALVIIRLLLDNRGFFAQFEKQITSVNTNVPTVATPSTSSSSTANAFGLPSLSDIEDELSDAFKPFQSSSD